MDAEKLRKTDLREALSALQNAHLALERIGKKEPSLLGLAGEILVMLKLQEMGVAFQPKGGQVSYDLLLTETKSHKKIEVRTSPLKKWLNRKVGVNLSGYVWPLLRSNQIPKYDLIICVAIETMDKGFDDVRFYVFTKDEVVDAKEIKHQRFSVSKLLHLPTSTEDFRNISRLPTTDFTEWERTIYPRIEEYSLKSRMSHLQD